MIRLALVIGGDSSGLEGIDRDVATMSATLDRYGFKVTRCQGREATRERVLAAFERLIADTQPGDAAVIYYSGHGGQVTNQVRDESQIAYLRPRYYQYLVPTDYSESRLGDFRGILDIELGCLLARLTTRTRNVAVILDCCHAEGTVRYSALLGDKNRQRNEWIARHVEDLEARERDRGPGLDHESNVHAIKLTASTAEQQSRETADEHGVVMGSLTRELCQVLDASRGSSVTWDEVYQRVAARVRARSPGQWPQIDGPVHRRLFELDELPVQGALALYHDGRRPYLNGGELVGVAEGERYAIMPLGAGRADSDSALAMATVIGVEPDRARIELVSRTHDERVAPARGLRSPVSWLEGARALPVTVREPGKSAAIARGLRSGSGHHALDAAFEITWGRMRDGRPAPAQTLRAGTTGFDSILTLASSDHIYFEFRSTDRKGPYTYWSVLAIDMNGAVRLCTRSARSGIAMAGGESYWLGARAGDRLDGVPMAQLCARELNAEDMCSFVVIITSRPVDLRALENAAGPPLHAGLDASQAQLFDPAMLAEGSSVRASREPLRYAVARLDARPDRDDINAA